MDKEYFIMSIVAGDCSVEDLVTWCKTNLQPNTVKLVLNRINMGNGLLGSIVFEREEDYILFKLSFTNIVRLVDWEELSYSERKIFRDQQTMWGLARF